MKMTFGYIKPALAVLSIVALSVIAPQISHAENVGQCMRHCELGNNQSKHSVTQSAAQIRLQEECERACQKLGGVQQEYRDCMANANSQADRKACQAGYRKNRPDTWKYR